MKCSEIIAKYQSNMVDYIEDHLREMYASDGSYQQTVYIWEDGEIECLTECCGSNSWLKANDQETRQLVSVCTISNQGFDWRDFVNDSLPDEEEEQEEYERVKQETIEWYIDEYSRQEASDLVERAIDSAEQNEDLADYIEKM